MEDHGECMLVLIGATPEGKKQPIGFRGGEPDRDRSVYVRGPGASLRTPPQLIANSILPGFPHCQKKRPQFGAG